MGSSESSVKVPSRDESEVHVSAHGNKFYFINLIRLFLKLLILLVCVCKPESYVSIVIPYFAGILSGLQSSVPHAYTHRRKLSCLPL